MTTTLEKARAYRLDIADLATKYGYAYGDSIVHRADFLARDLESRIKAEDDPVEALRLAERYDRRVRDREWFVAYGLARGVLVRRKGEVCTMSLAYDEFEDELRLDFDTLEGRSWGSECVGPLHQAEVPDCLTAKLEELRGDYPYDPERGF